MIRKILTASLLGGLMGFMGCAGPGVSSDLRAKPAAGGVVVIFENRGTPGAPNYCPKMVVPTDDECDDFGGKPLDHVCRYPSDTPEKSQNQKRVVWSSATATDATPPPQLFFNIEFETTPGPCQNNMGSGEAAQKICNAKPGNALQFDGDEATYKYSVTKKGCEPPLDPYIVFRNF